MEIFPAIDLREGQVVRLTHGDYSQVEVYSFDPASIARQFRENGAHNLHIVDLDGAKNGVPINYGAIRAITEMGGLFIQVGGGIRNEERIKEYLDLGVNRVILGTIAVEDFAFLERMVSKYGEAISVGADARDGKIAVRGWLETTTVDSMDFCKKLDKAGISTIIYTDISRDGAMSGTNLEVYRQLSGMLECKVVASGGISGLDDVRALCDMNLYGAILGKSLYTGAIDLKEVFALC